MKFLFTLGSILFFFHVSFSQSEKKDWLRTKFEEADSVLLISHDATAGISIVSDDGKRHIPLPNLIVYNHLNKKITHEMVLLNHSKIDTLINILQKNVPDKKIEIGKCFMPHNAIILMKKGKISFVEICFDCHNFDKSKDLEKLDNFNEKQWGDLFQFFLNQGMDYKWFRAL